MCQVITPLRSLVLCGENKQDMEEWFDTLRTVTENRQSDPGAADLLGGNHQWYATNHARPTYCNVCRDTLHGKELYFYTLLFIIIGLHEVTRER